MNNNGHAPEPSVGHDAKKLTAFVRCLFLIALLPAVWMESLSCCNAQTALDTYVAAPDTTYGFTPVATINGPGYTGYHIDLTSLTWRDPNEVTPNLWQHKMTITQPDTVLSSNTAMLFIDGGDNPGNFKLLPAEAVGSGATIVHLSTVPNQPLQFAGEGFTRQEDEIIAKTLANFLDGGDSEWPLLLPMVKSAVRAMDATQTHMANKGVTIDHFVVFGGSKRGWTAWLTAAVDDRVSALAAGVTDVLNMDESMAHHRRVYEGVTENIIGGYAQSVHDYVDENIFDRFYTPLGQDLVSIVDPYEYRDRLDMPKYLVNSTGDQFFVPDSSKFYFDDLIGPKYLRYIPNTDHALSTDASIDILEFYGAVAQGVALPDFSWTVSEGGTQITVSAVDAPTGVQLWQATNTERRDFRIETFGANWSASALVDQGGGQYVANVTVPATGATAFMVELEYLVNGSPIKFTTEVSVVQEPDADFDQDDDADGGDFLSWQRNDGITNGTLAQGDANVDRLVDADDLAAWKAQFGVVSTLSAANVPEPSAWVSLTVGLHFVSCLRFRLPHTENPALKTQC